MFTKKRNEDAILMAHVQIPEDSGRMYVGNMWMVVRVIVIGGEMEHCHKGRWRGPLRS